MSPEDWVQYRKMRVPWDEVKTLPPPSLMCLKGREADVTLFLVTVCRYVCVMLSRLHCRVDILVNNL